VSYLLVNKRVKRKFSSAVMVNESEFGGVGFGNGVNWLSGHSRQEIGAKRFGILGVCLCRVVLEGILLLVMKVWERSIDSAVVDC
jgi:hypothetical protein